MAYIEPFRAFIYNQEVVNDLSLVMAPPYDIISPEDWRILERRSPYNAVRIILGDPDHRDVEERYAQCARIFDEWKHRGILKRYPYPSIYLMHQKFYLKGKGLRKRVGFIALTRLEEFSSDRILPHEGTLLKPKMDRLKLLELCKANLCPIFGLYSDKENTISHMLEDEIKGREPLISTVDYEGVETELWSIHEPELIRSLKRLMEEKTIFIADGHHRYESALIYRDRMRSLNPNFTGKEAFNYVMMYLTNMDDPDGLTILPTHRMIKDPPFFLERSFLDLVKNEFSILEIPFNEGNEPVVREQFRAELERRGKERHVFGLIIKNIPSYLILELKDISHINEVMGNETPDALKELDVNILHYMILKRYLCIGEKAQEEQKYITYTKDFDEAIDGVIKGPYRMCFLLNPPKIEQVKRIATARLKMPQKSTYFWPKLPTGLVFNSIDKEEIAGV